MNQLKTVFNLSVFGFVFMIDFVILYASLIENWSGLNTINKFITTIFFTLGILLYLWCIYMTYKSRHDLSKGLGLCFSTYGIYMDNACHFEFYNTIF